MPCSETAAPAARGCWRRRLTAIGLVLGLVPAALAHKASDAYLELRASAEGGIALRWAIALRDLDAALDLDADGDGWLTWREVRTARPAIEAYALPRLALHGCPLRMQGHALERRSDGAYAVLQLGSACPLPAAPRWRYALFADTDPTHRGIARVEQAGGRQDVVLLDPTRPDGASEGATDSAAVANAASSFLAEGVHHIVTGYDHQLFLLCLILPAVMRRDGGRWQPVERLRDAVLPVLAIVTAFTLAHSVTLGLAALGWAALPAWFIEPAIAATIVLAALDNLRPIFGGVHRAMVALGFGLVHGFGFAGVLAELALPPGAFALALLQFNLGLELGQAAVVALAVAVLFVLRGWSRYPRVAIGGGSLAASVVGLAWFVERMAG
jgi:hypothetical protein